MAKFKVLGEDGEKVNVAGVEQTPGDVVELTEEAAAEGVAAGTLEVVEESAE